MGLASLLILSTYNPPADVKEGELVNVGTVTIWGTLPSEGIDQVLLGLHEADDNSRGITYKYFRPDQFDYELVTALADNRGPDLILYSQENLALMRPRIQPISYESFPIPDIRNLYLDGAQIFALSDGFYGYPIAVDPLMLFWNRDIFATESYLESPKTWESFVSNVFPALIKRDFNRTIERAVIAMGEYSNVRNAFGIISTLFLQGGTEGVTEESDGKYRVKLQSVAGGEGNPLRAAADFYTRFSRPDNALYSWNRAFSEDRAQFIAERLAMYFGHASEGKQLQKINPNLNFDIAEIPQGADATLRRTYGKFYALSVLRSSDNMSGAVAVMMKLGGPEFADKIAVASNMVPVYRGTVSAGSNDIFGRISYKSAPVAFGWLNPDPIATGEIFKTMTQDINENRRTLESAVSDASSRIGKEY